MIEIGGTTSFLGVLGQPVAHSLSPRLHNHWLQKLGLNAVYLPLPVSGEALPVVMPALPSLGCRGLNVTLPHKEQLLCLVTKIEPLAERVGAINTVVFKDGQSLGCNTDVFGFIESLRQAGQDPAASPAMILGAGGAARAVIIGLQQVGCQKILLANRSLDRAQRLASELGGAIEIVPWQDWPKRLNDCALLVNATSRGLKGVDDFIEDLASLPDKAAVCDLVYRPLKTGLLQSAERRGLKSIDGLGMLLYQAQASFHHWFGVTPPVDDALRRFVLAAS
jgi:shikimate dehydrogenase